MISTTIYSKCKRKTTEQFIIDSKLIHGDRYDYSNVNYSTASEKVEIACPEHGLFLQRPTSHYKYGCPSCGRIKSAKAQRKTLEDFITDSNKVHSNVYDYSKSKYKQSKDKIEIICKEHGSFYQSPNSHLQGNGCPECVTKGYSKISIEWLESFDLDIQHAENNGEFQIPNTNYRVDGYCKDNNTVYEFHGDAFHGNPNLYKYNDICHPFNKEVSAGELYDKTIQREDYIKSLGYNLIVIWENDYKRKEK